MPALQNVIQNGNPEPLIPTASEVHCMSQQGLDRKKDKTYGSYLERKEAVLGDAH